MRDASTDLETARPELVGRTGERGSAHAGLVRGRSVLLSGPEGIGKSHLADELAQMLRRSGWHVEVVRGSGRDAIPFAPFAHLMTVDSGYSQDLTEHLVRLRGHFQHLCRSGPAALFVDDAHELDDASAQLVRQIAVDDPIPVLLAARSTAPLPVGLPDLTRRDDADTIELPPLTRSEAASLVEHLLPAPPAAATEARWWELSRGTPLYLVEICRAALDAGTLVVHGGEAHAPSDLLVSRTLRDVVLARLDLLEEQERLAVDLLALAGRLRVGVLSRLVGDEVLDQLEALGLVTAGHVLATAPDVVLAHPLHAEVAAQQLTRGRARSIGSDLLAELERDEEPDAASAVLAGRLRLELELLSAPELLLAADHAFVSLDAELALELSEGAVTAGGGLPAEIRRVQALGLTTEGAQADLLFRSLAERATESADVAELAVRHAAHVAGVLGDPAAAADVLEVAATHLLVELDESDPHVRRVRAAESMTSFFAGDHSRTVATATPLVDEPVEIDALLAMTLSLAALGRPADVVPLLHRARDLVHLRTGTSVVSQLPVHLAFVRVLERWQEGRLADVGDPIEPFRSALSPCRITDALVEHGLPAALAAFSGRLDDAVAEHAELGDRIYEATAPVAWFHTALLAAVHAQRGDVEAATEALIRLDALPSSGRSGYSWWEQRARLWVAAARGDLDAAARGMLTLAQVHAEEQFHVTSSYEDVVRFGHPDLVVEGLERQAARPGATWWDAVTSAHAAAAARHDAEGLLAVAGTFEDGGLLLHALEAATEAALHAPPALAERAQSVITRLRPRCGTVATPGSRTPPAYRSLTARERLVASLASSGMTNRQIATRLGTSSRTVGNQLSSVYSKLGITSRRELQREHQRD